MSKNIRLSERYGVNPTIPLCFICGEPKNELILAGKLRGDAEAPKNAVWDMDPCDACKDLMEKGIILLEVDSKKTTDQKNPFRTGKMLVIKESAGLFSALTEDVRDQFLKNRVGYVDDESWKALGFDQAMESAPKELPTEPN